MIKEITTDELRRMWTDDGLILRGCGGDLNDWLNGINEQLTQEDILKDGTIFPDAYVFTKDGTTNLFFPFSEDVHVDVGKLALWRLQTYEAFGGIWLSDYVHNRLGGYENKDLIPNEKPDCKLIGEDGNIYNLMGIAARTLRQNGMKDEASRMIERITASGSYDEALCIIGDYVNITGSDEPKMEDFE